MSSILPQRQPCRPGPADVPVPRPRFLKTVAGFVLSGFVRGKIRRGDTNMDSLRRLLDEYLSIIPPVDQEEILVDFNQLAFVVYHTMHFSSLVEQDGEDQGKSQQTPLTSIGTLQDGQGLRKEVSTDTRDR